MTRNHSGMERTTRCISIRARNMTDQTLVRVQMRRFHGGRYELVRRPSRYIATHFICAGMLSIRPGLCRCHARISFARRGYLCQRRPINRLRYFTVESFTRQIRRMKIHNSRQMIVQSARCQYSNNLYQGFGCIAVILSYSIIRPGTGLTVQEGQHKDAIIIE